jgi:hypothetical protein
MEETLRAIRETRKKWKAMGRYAKQSDKAMQNVTLKEKGQR